MVRRERIVVRSIIRVEGGLAVFISWIDVRSVDNCAIVSDCWSGWFWIVEEGDDNGSASALKR